MNRLITLAFCCTISLPVIADDSDAIAEVRCTEMAFGHSFENKDQEAFAAFLDVLGPQGILVHGCGRGVCRNHESPLCASAGVPRFDIVPVARPGRATMSGATRG